ncbi:MAG: hypothetical protein H6912_04925, partial [Kordiimonadaceae bacterium]|nr:hypothetical protein [Kordiimonadaceae bacterium]
MFKKSIFSMKLIAVLVFLFNSHAVLAQTVESVQPFKVGTFAIEDRRTVGLVLQNDKIIIDLAAANRALELLPQYSKVEIPDDMIGLISQYEYGLKNRIYEIVNWIVENDLISNQDEHSFIYAVDEVDILAPIQYPSKLMNAAVNFY